MAYKMFPEEKLSQAGQKTKKILVHLFTHFRRTYWISDRHRPMSGTNNLVCIMHESLLKKDLFMLNQ